MRRPAIGRKMLHGDDGCVKWVKCQGLPLAHLLYADSFHNSGFNEYAYPYTYRLGL